MIDRGKGRFQDKLKSRTPKRSTKSPHGHLPQPPGCKAQATGQLLAKSRSAWAPLAVRPDVSVGKHPAVRIQSKVHLQRDHDVSKHCILLRANPSHQEVIWKIPDLQSYCWWLKWWRSCTMPGMKGLVYHGMQTGYQLVEDWDCHSQLQIVSPIRFGKSRWGVPCVHLI